MSIKIKTEYYYSTLIKAKLLYPCTWLMTFSLIIVDKYLLSNLKICTKFFIKVLDLLNYK